METLVVQDIPSFLRPHALVGSQSDFPHLCFHTLFEQYAAQNPSATAICFEDERHQGFDVSYRTLNMRANALAEVLCDQWQLQPGEVVGVCLPPSLEVALSFLAINKAGGAALFLDTEAPAERLSFLLEQANARLLLTLHSQDKNVQVPKESKIETSVLYLEDYSSHRLERNIDVGSTMDSAAYAIATSGTEGTPKIVLVPQRALANYISTFTTLRAVQPGARVLQIFSPYFDASVGQTVLALASGATLCLGARAILSSGPAILTFMQKHRISHAAFTPSILAAVPAADLPHLQSIECGGEKCSVALARQWATGRQFINAYGPTECTIAASYFECPPDFDGEIPLGIPLQNTWIAVVDHQQQPVAVGEAGEIVIGGSGLAQGYLGQPVVTSQQFVVQEGCRFYRTGDKGYIDENGQLCYVGRISEDLEVKVAGGRRFDRGEIESKLLGHTDILACAVVLWKGHLVSFIVPRDPRVRPTVASLNAYLATWLPEFAIPRFFIWRESLPLTSNGKIAHDALPIPDWSAFARQGEFRMPLSQTEQQLAQLAAEVLDPFNPTQVVVNALCSFVALGLDSLSITDFLLGVQSAFECEVDLDEGELLNMSLEHFANYLNTPSQGV